MSAATLRVCVLDDHRLFREGVALLLQREGIEVVGSDGSLAPFLERISQQRPDAAIVDLIFPDGAGGAGMIAELRSRFPSLPLLVVSGATEPELADTCAALGVAGFLEKGSAGPQALVDAVRAVAAGQKVFPARTLAIGPRAESSSPAAAALRGLTTREREVLTYIAAGFDNLKIAAQLDITERTVRAHVSSLYRKLGQENRTQMALFAGSLGLRPPKVG